MNRDELLQMKLHEVQSCYPGVVGPTDILRVLSGWIYYTEGPHGTKVGTFVPENP